MARTELAAAADALAAGSELHHLVEHSRRVASAGGELRRAQAVMDAAYASGGRIARWTLGRRRNKDAVLDARVAGVIQRRKAGSAVKRRGTKDFPVHDWLKDAWQ